MQEQRLLELFLLDILLVSSGKLCIAGDLCSWKGSGLSWESAPRAVEQVNLRCTKGSLEWMYPTRALRVIIEPNLVNSKCTSICIKPYSHFQGAHIYVEKSTELHLLVSEGDVLQEVYCFGMNNFRKAVLFLQAIPQKDLGRRTAGFQYELLNSHNSESVFQKFGLVEDACRPCDNNDLLMAICRSDFVVRGSIKSVTHDTESNISWVDVNAVKVYRQRNSIFQQDRSTGTWAGSIRTLVQCGVKQGEGNFLFTGSEHFGDAWLGCAPRYEHFLQIYQEAKKMRINYCVFQA